MPFALEDFDSNCDLFRSVELSAKVEVTFGHEAYLRQHVRGGGSHVGGQSSLTAAASRINGTAAAGDRAVSIASCLVCRRRGRD